MVYVVGSFGTLKRYWKTSNRQWEAGVTTSILAFEVLSTSLAQESLLLTVVWYVSGILCNLTHRIDLELLVIGRKHLILVLMGWIAAFPTDWSASEDSLIFADLLLLANWLGGSWAVVTHVIGGAWAR